HRHERRAHVPRLGGGYRHEEPEHHAADGSAVLGAGGVPRDLQYRGRRGPTPEWVEPAHGRAAERSRPAREQQQLLRSGRLSRLGAGDGSAAHGRATGAGERGPAERSIAMTRLRGWLLVVLALAGSAGSCSSDGGTGPVAGVLTVALATPTPGADGAMLFRVSGPQVLTSVT